MFLYSGTDQVPIVTSSCFIPNDDPPDYIQAIRSASHLAGMQYTTNLSQLPEYSDIYPSDPSYDTRTERNGTDIYNEDTLHQTGSQTGVSMSDEHLILQQQSNISIIS